jgi:hypothetical protein
LPPPSADKIVEICLVLEIEPAELLALIGKLPTNVQRAVGTSEVAQVFARGTTDGSVGSRMERIGSFVKKAALAAPHNNVDVDKGGGFLQTGCAKTWSAQVKKDEPPTAILPKHDLPRQG